jgi:HlyD family type I secretion membrane fusion protein
MSNVPAIVRLPKDPTTDLSAIDDRQTQLRILMRHQNRTIRFGWLMVALFFGGLCGWAAFMPLSGAIVAMGDLVVEGKNKPVQHYGGGLVAEILVSDGDPVEEGQVLLRLDPTTTDASAEVSQARYRAVLAQEARLLAERDALPAIQWPQELKESADNPEIAAFMAAQQKIFDARRAALSGQQSILAERIEQLREEIAGVRAQIVGVNQQLGLIRDESGTVQKLVNEGLAVKSRLLALQRLEAGLVGTKGSLESTVARTEQRINETRLQMENLRDQTYAGVVDELKNVRSSLKDLEEQRKVASVMAGRTDVRAPVSGTVQGMRVTGIGQVVGNGELLMEIVPRDQPLVASIKLQPHYIDEIQVGHQAEVKLPFYNTRTFSKEIRGEVTFVAADITQPQGYIDIQRFPTGYYNAKIIIDQKDLETYARTDNIQLFPGAPVTVIIPTHERTALEYFLGPVLQGLDQAFREE